MQTLSGNLLVDSAFCNFVQGELLHGLPLAPSAFWQLLESTFDRFIDRNEALIARREELQSKIDAFHTLHRQSVPVTQDEYISFLTSIGYLEPPAAPFTITSHLSGLDSEINIVCGPQIVVPVTRARFALNAANSRWGSLYDVLCVEHVTAPAKCNICADMARMRWHRRSLRALLPPRNRPPVSVRPVRCT
jgi:malate synthase